MLIHEITAKVFVDTSHNIVSGLRMFIKITVPWNEMTVMLEGS